MKRMCVAMIMAAACACFAVSFATAEDEEDKTPSIKDVMAKCMKGNSLCKKVAGGQASTEEKKELLENFTALSKAKPPKGDAANWKKMTDPLVKAAKMAVDGDSGAGDALKKAANCAACHKAHKPS